MIFQIWLFLRLIIILLSCFAFPFFLHINIRMYFLFVDPFNRYRPDIGKKIVKNMGKYFTEMYNKYIISSVFYFKHFLPEFFFTISTGKCFIAMCELMSIQCPCTSKSKTTFKTTMWLIIGMLFQTVFFKQRNQSEL